MTPPETDLQETARLWAIRVRDAAFDRWDEFTQWLEQDPGNLPAYEAALATDEWAGDMLASRPSPVAATPQRPRAVRRWPALAGIAAAIVAVIGGWLLLGMGMTEISTRPGEHRVVHLADGSVVTLNGETRIRFDEDKPRQVALLEGEALFDVRHDEADPFTVTAGDTRLVDIGTVFNVVHVEDELDVAVAHGAVMFAPGPQQVRLDAGQALFRQGKVAPVLRRVSTQSVGGWQSGQLQYENAPLASVARDLGRNTGLDIRAGEDTAQMRFTGTVHVKGAPEELFARIGPLLGVSFAEWGEGWTMTATNGPAP